MKIFGKYSLDGTIAMTIDELTTGTALYKRAGDTGEIEHDIVKNIVNAIKAGFRHIDGAQIYGTEPEIGEAIRQAGVPRSELFITTKQVSDWDDPAGKLVESLKKLGTDYVDLYLIHQPWKAPIEEVWPKYEKILESGKARAIGVSNFRKSDFDRLFKVAKVKPAVNQIEYHPLLQNQSPDVISICHQHGILVSSYGPLGPLVKGTTPELVSYLDELAGKYEKSPNQVLLRWHLQTGVLPITTTNKEERLKESLDIYDFELTDAETTKISEIGAKDHLRRFFKDDQF
jgi:2-dehydropantolactone reductase